MSPREQPQHDENHEEKELEPSKLQQSTLCILRMFGFRLWVLVSLPWLSVRGALCHGLFNPKRVNLHTENVLVVPVVFAVATATVMLLRLTEIVIITLRTDIPSL